MKIVHIITKFNEMYGAQRHITECAKIHVNMQNICTIITGSYDQSCNEAEIAGCNVLINRHLRNSYLLFNDIFAFLTLIQMLKKLKPDIVISHSSKAGLIARLACYFLKTPNMFTVHGWAFEEGAPLFQKTISRLLEIVMKPLTDYYCCVSDYTSSYGITKIGLSHKNTYVCPGFHHPMDDDIVELNSYTRKVLMVAGLRKQKDHKTALQALRLIVDEYGKNYVQFVFVGDGSEKENLINFAQQLGIEKNVLFIGAVKDVESYYLSADIVILPTFFEGLPLTLIEALKCKKPIIASNVGGIPEVVNHGYNGFLIDVNNSIQLANSIALIYENNLVKSYGHASYELYLEKYSYTVVKNKFVSIIDNVIQNSRFN